MTREIGFDVFAEYFGEVEFVDRFLNDPERGVTVIIPVIHSNGFWRKNLESFYREIPIRRLLLADGGCVDNTLQVAGQFPRVDVLDHKAYKSLGFSIRHLIEAVDTPWFVYLQSDVYLPPGWFDEMWSHTSDYDWFGCSERHTVMVEYEGDFGSRPWAGSQMGRREAFSAGLPVVDDDYVYRQEDYVFADIVKRAGYREGKVGSTFHFHQTQFKESPFARRVVGVHLDVETSLEEQRRQSAMHGRGIVKYLPPDSWDLAIQVARSNAVLRKMGHAEEAATARWIRETNPGWLWRVRIAALGLSLDSFYWKAVSLPPRAAKALLRRFRRA